MNIKNELDDSTIFICEKYFEEKVINKENDKRKRLRMSLNLVPTIYPEAIAKTTLSVLPSSTPFLKPPKRISFQDDDINRQQFQKLRVKEFSEINENAL